MDLLGFSKPLDLFYPALNQGPRCQHNMFRVGKQLVGRSGMCSWGSEPKEEGEEQGKVDPGNSQLLPLYSTEFFCHVI